MDQFFMVLMAAVEKVWSESDPYVKNYLEAVEVRFTNSNTAQQFGVNYMSE
jgi:hypothetical protein